MYEWFERGREIYRNAHENDFYNRAQNAGWKVTKQGWPDFFCVTPEGKVVAVEVKQRASKSKRHAKYGWFYQGLRRDQITVLKALEALGVEVRISDGTHLGEKIDWASHDAYRGARTTATRGKTLVPAVEEPEGGWYDEFKKSRVDKVV